MPHRKGGSKSGWLLQTWERKSWSPSLRRWTDLTRRHTHRPWRVEEGRLWAQTPQTTMSLGRKVTALKQKLVACDL